MTANKVMLVNIAKKLFKSGLVDITTENVKLTLNGQVFKFKYYTPEQFKEFLENETNAAQKWMWKVGNNGGLPSGWEAIEFHLEDSLKRYYVKFIKN